MTMTTISMQSEDAAEFQWTEPELLSEKVEVFDANDYVIDVSFQNRNGSAKKALSETEDGFIANKDKVDSIADYYITQAMRGVASHNAVPSVTVAVLVNEAGDVVNEYFIGGHGRAAGLMLARKGSSSGRADDLHEDDDSVDGDSEVKDVSSLLTKLRIRKFECQNDRDMQTLAGLENSDSQNGERLKPAERRAIIEDGLRDPAKAQYKDLAFAVKFLNDPACRSTVNNARKKLWKAGETSLQQGVLNVNGTPQKPSRPGSILKDKVDKLGNQLETEFNSLGKLSVEDIDEDTYKGFEKLRAKWEKARADASRFLQERNDVSGKTEDEMLTDALKSLEDRIGYTAYQESLIEPEPVDSETDPSEPDSDVDDEDIDAIEEARRVAENMQQEEIDEDEDEDEEDDEDEDVDETDNSDTPPDAETEYAKGVGRVYFIAKTLHQQADALEISCDKEGVHVADSEIKSLITQIETIKELLFTELTRANDSA